MRIISLFLLLWCALIADEWRDVLGTVDAQQVALDGDAAKVTAVEVINVKENSAAQTMGLRIGDHILAYDGLRCFGEGERNLIRYRYQPLSDTLRITVLRGGKIIELETRDIKPVQIIGFVAQVNDRAAYRAALESAGFPSMDTTVCDVADFPRRAGCALLRWKTKAPQHIEPDHAWINRLAICFQALVEQQWAKAEKIAIGVPDSCPELQRLERFYHALAAYHAGGERAPDPNHYGEPLLYDVIHYPYPHLKLPEIGNFTHTDSVFMDMLKKKQSDPVNYSDIEPVDIGVRQSLSNRSYSSFVLLSLFHYQYGGWPYRSDSVYQPDSRHQLVAQLNSEIVSGSPNATWSRFCLVFPTFLNARFDDLPEEKRAQEREAAITLLEKVRKEAPLLGHLGYVILELAHSYYELSEYRDSLRAHLESGPMIAAAKPSLLLDYLRAHEASLVFHLFNEETIPSLSLNLHYVHAALGRQLPLIELRRRLAADGVDRLPLDQRLELMALARDYFHDSCNVLDGRSLLRLALPGLSCDAFSEIAFWHLRRHRDQAWIFALIGLQTEVVVSAALVSQMQTEISHIRWADSPAATAAVWSAYMTMGSPPATLLLAQACDDHGLNSLGSELRTRVQKSQKNFQALAIHGEFVDYFRDMIDEICLVTSCPWGDSIANAIAAGERFQKRYPAEKQWDSICLYLAHAHLTAGHPGPAVDALIDSFVAPQIDPAPSYFTAKDGQIATTRAFRTWLVKKLLPMPGFGDAQRKRLIAATQADLVDEEFAKILGVAPEAFGKKSAVGANDF